MGYFPIILVSIVLLASIGVESKKCGKDEYKVTLTIKTRFQQRSVVESYKYAEKIRSSKSFKKKLEEMSTEASISGSYGAFSASASAAYSSLTDSIESSEEDSKDVNVDKTTFNQGFLQIFQEIITQINLDGKTATMTKTEWTNSVPVDKPWNSTKLREEAAAYMDWEFGEGANKNRYTETVCRKRISNSELLKKKEGSKHQIWTDSGTGAWRDFSCWNPVGDGMLASIPENGYDGRFKSYTFSGADGVLANPKDYRRVLREYLRFETHHNIFSLRLGRTLEVDPRETCHFGNLSAVQAMWH